MIADHLTGIEEFVADLWKVADSLRTNRTSYQKGTSCANLA